MKWWREWPTFMNVINQINRISSTTLNQRAKRPAKTGFILDKSY